MANLRLNLFRSPNEEKATDSTTPFIPPGNSSPSAFPQAIKTAPVPDNALLWKELVEVNGTRLLAFCVAFTAIIGFGHAGAFRFFATYGWIGFEAHGYESRFIFTVFYINGVICLTFLLSFRLTAVISREHEQGTLPFLLLLPIERSEILWTKFIAPWIVTRSLLATLLIAPIFAWVTGIHSFRTCGVLLFLPWPSVIFAAGLALYLSVRCRRWLTANVEFLVAVSVIGFAHLFGGEYTQLLLDGFWMLFTGENVRAEQPMLAVGMLLGHQAALMAIGAFLIWRAFARFEGRKRMRQPGDL